MTLDPRIKEAITEAARELDQDQALASKLVAWFEAIADGNESLEDRDATYRRLRLLYDATSVEGGDE